MPFRGGIVIILGMSSRKRKMTKKRLRNPLRFLRGEISFAEKSHCEKKAPPPSLVCVLQKELSEIHLPSFRNRGVHTAIHCHRM